MKKLPTPLPPLHASKGQVGNLDLCPGEASKEASQHPNWAPMREGYVGQVGSHDTGFSGDHLERLDIHPTRL